MIISKTPFRISFFGGGTDYPAWYKEHGGAVISAAINKYSYITCRHLPPFFDYKYRIRYYLREETNRIEDIKHPSVRECLAFSKLSKGADIVHHADLPAQAGLGSSSTFTVGLLHALSALNYKMPTKYELAINAIRIEQDKLNENVGSQDQTAAAFGGLNLIEFGGNQEIIVKQMIMPPCRIANLQNNLMLFFTGFSRNASDIAEEQIQLIPSKKNYLNQMMQLVSEANNLLLSKTERLNEFGRLLHEQWVVKKQMSSKITNADIDLIYQTGIDAGALGGKLLGAGGGGFMLFYVEPELQSKVRQALSRLLYVPIGFDHLGSQIIYHSLEEEY